MYKIIFLLWLLSGKVQVQKDKFGFNDYNEGRPLYKLVISPSDTQTYLYKGEILNYIRNKKIEINEDLSDINGKPIDPIYAVDTLFYDHKGITKAFPLYADGKRRYVIDEHLKVKVYLKK